MAYVRGNAISAGLPLELELSSATRNRSAPDRGRESLSPSSQWQDASLAILAALKRTDLLVRSLLPSTDNPMSAEQVVPASRQALSDQQQALRRVQGLAQERQATN